jgi:hypothetical protein
VKGDARSPHTGSIKTRLPSISTSRVECPSQVMRRPSAGSSLKSLAFRRTMGGASSGLAWSLLSVSHTQKARKPGMLLGRVFWKASPFHWGDTSTRRRHMPLGRSPMAVQPLAKMPAPVRVRRMRTAAVILNHRRDQNRMRTSRVWRSRCPQRALGGVTLVEPGARRKRNQVNPLT